MVDGRVVVLVLGLGHLLFVVDLLDEGLELFDNLLLFAAFFECEGL